MMVNSGKGLGTLLLMIAGEEKILLMTTIETEQYIYLKLGLKYIHGYNERRLQYVKSSDVSLNLSHHLW